jgi:hypothetical protein
MLNPIANSGPVAGPLFCRFETEESASVKLKGEYMRTFAGAWTSFPLQPEATFPGLQNGARYGHGIVLVSRKGQSLDGDNKIREVKGGGYENAEP